MDSQSELEFVKKIGSTLKDSNEPLKKRFRFLFTLRNLGGLKAIEYINDVLISDKSVLLKHECCYCLGQMGDKAAVDHLVRILKDEFEDEIVRHEAGEALGNLCDNESDILNVLESSLKDKSEIVSQTCELALALIRWRNTTSDEEKEKLNKLSPYHSKDPAPCFEFNKSIEELEKMLIDPSTSLFDKYRALFTLRNLGSEAAIHALGKALTHYKHNKHMTLFKHEVSYIFGQMKSQHSKPYLKEMLKVETEHEIVRHESAEALGSVADKESLDFLKQYLNDESTIVRNSVEIALDIGEYENSCSQFNFIN